MATDEQLVLEFQGGSHEAFTELFDRYREAIYAFFRRRLENAGRAEELAQETFLAVLRNVRSYEPRALFRTYLYAIAFNQLSAERRKSSRESDSLAGNPSPAASKGAEESLGVREAINKLAPDEREILMLREYEQLSYEEVAAVLHLPVGTVRSRLFRARLALKQLLLSERGAASG